MARSELVRFVPTTTRRLLDVGCGRGHYGAEVADAIPGVELWGVEPDGDSFEEAKGSFQTVLRGSFPETATQLPQRAFDVITFNDVLEHMVEPTQALEAAKTLLDPTGTVIASIPNVRHRSVLWALAKDGDWTYEDYGPLDRTHLRFFTRKSMLELFSRSGWRVLSCEGVNPCWHWRDMGERPWVRSLRNVTAHRLDDFLFKQYVVTARPA